MICFAVILIGSNHLTGQTATFVAAGYSSGDGIYNIRATTIGGLDGLGGFTMSGTGYTYNATTFYLCQVSFDNGTNYYNISGGNASTGTMGAGGFWQPNTSGDVQISFQHSRMATDIAAWPGNDGTIHCRVAAVAGNFYSSATAFTLDLTRPSINTAVITSNNSTNNAYATTGNQITITFTSSESLNNTVDNATTNPIVSDISGVNATASGSGTSWTVFNTVSTHSDGTATFSIVYYDVNENSGASTLSSTTDNSIVTVDKTSPTVTASIASNNATASLAKADDIVTLTISSTETLYEAPTVTIDGNAETTNPTIAASSYSATRTMEAADTQGAVAFIISGIKDQAGNTASNVTATNDATSVTFDSVVPTLTGLTIASSANFDNNNTTSIAKSGDVTTITFFTSEPSQTPVATIATETATVTGSSATWAAAKTMDDDDANGTVPFTVDFKDLAGNAGTRQTAVLTGSDVTFDSVDPTINTAVITSSNATNTLATVGDVISLAIGAAEDLYSLTNVTVAGQTVDPANISNTNAQTWSFQYTMQNTDADGAVAFTFTANDLAGNGTTVTAATSGSVMFDKTAPILSTVEIVSNNANTAYAKQNDIVTMTIASNEDLSAAPTVLLAGRAAAVATTDARNYTATMTMNNTDTEGAMAISINFTDLYGNDGTTVAATTNSSSIIYDRTGPTLTPVTYSSNNANASYAKTGDIITLSFTGSENLMSTASGGTDPVATIATAAAVESGTGASWTATYTMQAGDTEAAIPFTIDFNDIAGNVGTQVTGLTSGSSITYDETVPTLTTVSIASNNSAGPTLATVSNVITLSIVALENIQTPTVTIGGNAATIATGSNGETSYTATYTMLATDAAAAPIAFTVNFKDLANNDGTQVVALANDLDGGVTFDKQAPSFTTVSIASNNSTNTLAKVGDIITLTLASDEPIKTGADPTVKISTVSGVGNTATVSRATPTSFTAAYSMTSSDDEGVVAISISNFTDATGNAGTTQTTTLDGSSVTFDKTVPTIPTRTILSNNANTAFAKENDIVTLTIIAAEDLQTPTVLLGGDAATVTAGASASRWTAAKVMDDTDTQGAISISIAFLDLAGNPGVTLTSSSDGNNVTYDRSAPSITTATIASNNTTDDILAVPDNTVTLTFISDEDIQTPTVTIATQTATVVAGADAKNWTATYIMTNNESNGTVPFEITYMDLASNAGAAQTALINDVDGAVTFDKTQPSLSGVALTSDNTINNAYGREGSILTLTFSASEQLNSAQMAVTIATQTVTPSITTAWNGTAEIWAASYTLGGSDYTGQSGVTIPFTIDYEDLNGYDGTQVTEAAAAATMTFDRNAPTITSYTAASSSGTNFAKANDVITLTLVANENIDEPVITIAGQTKAGGLVAINQGGNTQTWTATYTMQGTDDDIAAIASTLSFTDLAGNAGTSQNPTPSIVFDKTVPTATSITISSNNTNSTAAIAAGSLAKPGDILTLLITFSEAIASPVVTIAGQTPTSLTNPSSDQMNWQATYLTTAATADGAVAFTIDFTDASGNNGTQIVTTVTSGSNVTFDGTASTITPVAISSNNTFSHFAKTGDLVTLTFTANEDIDTRQLPTVSIAGALSSSGAGNAAAVARTGASGGSFNYSASYTMGSGATTDEAGIIQFVLAFEDIAGNAGTNVIAITTGSNVTFDKTNPAANTYTINCTQASTLTTRRAKINEPVTLAMVFNDEIKKPSITIGGNAIPDDDVIQGADRTIWSASYTMTLADIEDGNRMNFTIAMTDSAGNTGTTINATAGSDASFVIFDKTAPSAGTLTIVSDNTWDDYGLGHPINPNLFAISGNTITITAISNEALGTSTALIRTAVSGGGIETYTAADAVSSSNSDLTWASTYTMQPADVEGEVKFKVALSDSAGNVSDTLTNADITNGSSIEYDREKPNSNNITIALSSGSDTGKEDDDKLINLIRPKFDITRTGGLTLGDSILVAVDDDIKFRQVVRAGITSFLDSTLHSDMTHDINAGHEIKVYLRDPAGNLSDPSPAITVKVDTEIPTTGAAPDLLALDDSGWADDDNTTNDPDPRFLITGLTTATDSIDLFAFGIDPASAGSTKVASDRKDAGFDHTISMAIPVTSNGKYGFYYIMHDDAGNKSVESDTARVIFDFIAPAAPGQPDLFASTDLGELNNDNITDTNVVKIDINYQEPYTKGYLYRVRYNDGNIIQDTSLVNAALSDTASLLVRANGTKRYTLNDEISDGDSSRIDYYPVTIDSAGNSIEGLDISIWYDYKDPTGIVTYSDADDTVWAGNSSTVATITFNEALSISPRPKITLTYPEAGGTVGPVDLINDDNGLNKKWRYTIDLDDPDYQDIDGYMNIVITADDIAGNPVSLANLTDENKLLFDNTKPEFRNITPTDNAYIHVLNGFSWFLTEEIVSGIVHFDNQDLPSAADIQVVLTGTELTTYGFSTVPNALLSGNPQLVDGDLYNITYQGIDIAGNTGMDTVYSVRYDTTMPTASLNFSRLFASKDTTVICTVKFNEPMLASPHISLDYGGAAYTADDVDSMAMTATDDASIWVYSAIMPDGIANQGIVQPTVYAKDLATNDLDSMIIAATDSLYLDNTVATATLTYTNITQDTILVHHPNSLDDPDTLWNVGIGGDTIRITVTMNEPIITNPIPSLTLKYNSGTGAIGTINNASASNGDSVWVFDNIVLLDSVQNDGILKVELNALDRSTNPVGEYATSTDQLFKVDNKPPAAFDLSAIRLSSVNPSLVVDWQDLGNNWIDMDNDPLHNWYNKRVTHFYVNVPLPPYDIPGLTDTTMWGGLVGIEFKNLRGLMNGEEWVKIGVPDTLDPQVDFDSTLFFRDTNTINSLILDELVLGDSLILRVSQTDIHGNMTYSNIDLTDKHKFFYDRTQMNVGQLVGGNIINQEALISTDTISVNWTDFLDPGGTGASGFWKYTFTVAHHIVTALGDTLSDTSMTGYYNGEMWQDWIEIETAESNAAFIFNSADVDTLRHNELYEFLIFAQDLAGNMSDTISSGKKFKYNSNPILSSINSWTMYEDSIYSNFQNIQASDLDSLTFQGDNISYSVETFQVIATDTTYSPHPIDIEENILSWSPIQSDVGNYTVRVIAEDLTQLADTTEFTLEVIAVNDAPELVFVDSMGFLINPDSVLVFSFEEDVQTSPTLNLTQYVTDVDNNDSTEITWQAVILDTNQLGKPYPMGQIIVGPGTSMKQKVSLMKEFMGVNPNFGFNLNFSMAPMVEGQTRKTIADRSSDRHPITIALDTLGTGEILAVFDSDSNYYGDEHRVIFIVQDPFVPGDPFSRLEARDTIIVSVKEQNDVPVMQDIGDWNIAENDSLVLDFGSYTTDVDDSVLTFVIKAITNAEYMTILPDSFLSSGTGDSVILKPQPLWSAESQIQVVALDEVDSDTSIFLLDIIRVVRPAPSVSIVQNNVFSHYLDIVIVDTVQKTTDISFDIQSEPMILDTIAPYTWTSNFNFGVEKSYSFEIRAEAVVGDTMWGNAFVLALAQSASRWFGSSSDGSFTVTGESGSVPTDQPLLIVDSTLFNRHFTDHASYSVGNENYKFQAPVRVSLASRDVERALYHRENGTWTELPSISTEGRIITYSDQAGYYRLGPKTIIVPEMTNLHPNYPNPFNPVTNIRYDIGLLDGLQQNVSIHVYNLLGQRIRTLVKNVDQLGQFTIQWDGRNETGKDMPTGIYFVQLTTSNGIIKNSKMMLLK